MIKHNKGVRDFFKNDYPKLYLLSGSQIPTDINLDDKSRMGYYCNVLAITWLAINQLEDTPQHPYRTIIIEHYIKHTRLKDLEPLIGYRHSATCKKINEALVCFANEYNKQADRYNLEFRFQ